MDYPIEYCNLLSSIQIDAVKHTLIMDEVAMNIDIKDAQNVYNNLIDNAFNKQENKSAEIKQIDINTVPDRSLHQLPYETAEKLFNLFGRKTLPLESP